VADLQKQKLVSQAKDLQNQETRASADPALAARLDAYRQEQRAIGGAAIAEVAKAKREAAKTRPREEDEKQISNQNAEPIPNASVRYAQALGQHYNVLDPYASLARAAMAEHTAFRGDVERFDKQIAQAANPEVRRELELRKDIEKADYVALTSDRIARQSYVITGNKGPNSEFDKFSKQAEHNRQHATELRQQWRDLTQPEQQRSQTANTQTAQAAPEQVRAERIAAVTDPNLRQELDNIAKARDAKLAEEREKQRQSYDKRVGDLRDQKIKSANAPQLTPRGTRSPYLGETGHARATSDAKAQIQTLDHEYLKKLAREYNGQIDKRLDAHRDIQADREPGRIQAPAAEPQRGPTVESRAPNFSAESKNRPAAPPNDQDAALKRIQEQQRQRTRGPRR